LPATIVDLAGLAAGAPFPGRSLARLWDYSQRPAAEPTETGGALSELPEPNPIAPSWGRSPAARGPLVSLAQGDYVYIRNERDGQQELYFERDDPRELSNRAQDEAMQPILQRLRQGLDGIKADPTRGWR
jgi:hypothetical protein